MALLKKKDRFVFNTQTLSYEKAVVGWGTRIFRFVAFMVAAFVFSLVISRPPHNDPTFADTFFFSSSQQTAHC